MSSATFPAGRALVSPDELQREIDDRCCHLVSHPLLDGETVGSFSRRAALCGFEPNARVHDIGDPLAFMCETCRRPRCPECTIRFGRAHR